MAAAAMAGLQQQGCRCGRVASCSVGDGPSRFPAVVVSGARHGFDGLCSASDELGRKGEREKASEEGLPGDKVGWSGGWPDRGHVSHTGVGLSEEEIIRIKQNIFLLFHMYIV